MPTCTRALWYAAEQIHRRRPLHRFHRLHTLLARLAGAVLVLAGAGWASAAPLTVPSKQVGTFFEDGVAENHVGFQNYHVGYSTLSSRAESRAFYVFDLPLFGPGLGELLGIEFVIQLPFGGLVFGGSPDPTDPSKVLMDTEETFAIALSPFSASLVTADGIDPAAALSVFASLGTGNLGSKTFVAGSELATAPLPPPVYFSLEVAEVVVPFSAAGVALFTSVAHGGATVVLGGHMASWTRNEETYPSGPLAGKLMEKSEEIFGLSDVVGYVPPLDASAATGLPYPELRFVFAPVPEPGAAWLLGVGALLLAGAQRLGVGRPHRR